MQKLKHITLYVVIFEGFKIQKFTVVQILSTLIPPNQCAAL